MTRNLIDWLSISIPSNSIFQKDQASNNYYINEEFRKAYPPLCDWLQSWDDISVGQGRRVFQRSLHSHKGGWTYFFSDTLPYCLVEITGTGCENLRQKKWLGTFVKHYGHLLTRIDISRDITCDADPRVFANMRDVKRFESYEEKKEKSGITYYVGSRESERYACVYRYAEPHPRSGELRVEHRLKGDYAKSAAKELLASDTATMISRLGNLFGWTHPAWNLNPAVGKPEPVPRDTKQGSRERWLLTSVLPAIKGLLDNGGDEFVDYFLEQCYHLLNDYRSNRS
jgi:hypothetical protein